MNFDDRMARRRQLALIEAQSLVSINQISLGDLEQLESELAERREALAGRIAEVRALMNAHGISLEEILDEGPVTAGHVTHRHPVTGQTWNGMGVQPEWLRNALLTEGYRPGDLRVASRPQGDEGPSD